MKRFFTALFRPLLERLDAGEGRFEYKPSHRKILLGVGALFTVLTLVSVAAAGVTRSWGAAIPVLVFAGASLVCFAVGALGSDRAVARLWGSK